MLGKLCRRARCLAVIVVAFGGLVLSATALADGSDQSVAYQSNPAHNGWLSAVNPLSYEVNALRGLLIGTPTDGLLDIAVLAVAAVVGIAMASGLLRRLLR